MPLTAAPETREPREFRAKIVPQAEATRPFQTLELRPAAPASGGKKICEPRVSVQRDGDRVTNIRVAMHLRPGDGSWRASMTSRQKPA